jgi:nucleoside 2-deoxyribosyltransferase
MNLLKDTRCYLAGPVEHDNKATSWRKSVALKLSKLGVKPFDPLIKPPWLKGYCHAHPKEYRRVMDGDESEEGYVRTYPKGKVWLQKSNVIAANRDMRKVDMRIVSAVDWIVCYLPVTFTSGTFEEVYEALRQGKPVFFCCPEGIPSTWLLAATGATEHDYHEIFFKDWKSLINHVRKIDKGQIVLDSHKWVFLTWREEGWDLPLKEYWEQKLLEYDAKAGRWRKKDA